MLFDEIHYRFMWAALQEAEQAAEEDEVPVGAVVVYRNSIIGRGHNRTEKLSDPTAHAEMIAITAASYHLRQQRLTECDLYVTLEPCAMCAAAALHARIRTLYFAAFDPKFGACGSLYNIIAEGKYNHIIPAYQGIYDKESKTLLKNYFKGKRENHNKHSGTLNR